MGLRLRLISFIYYFHFYFSLNKKRKIINHYSSLQLVIIIINTNGGDTKGLGPKVDKTLEHSSWTLVMDLQTTKGV